MPDQEPDILAQFAEFLKAKEENDKETAASEDFDVEIWDKDGRGVKTKRSHAKPFLQSLGIDLDPDPESGDGSGDNSDGDAGKGKPKGPRQGKVSPPGPQSTVRKYFTGKPAGK